MPESSGSLSVAAGVGKPSRASVGGTAPAASRSSSVKSAIQSRGVGGQQHAPGAGVRAVGMIAMPKGVLIVAAGGDPEDLVQQTNRQYFGGRPSGFSEAFKALREAYLRNESRIDESIRRNARELLANQDRLVEYYNENARQLGLPVVQLPSEQFIDLIVSAGLNEGDPGGLGGAEVSIEMIPAWLADP